MPSRAPIADRVASVTADAETNGYGSPQRSRMADEQGRHIVQKATFGQRFVGWIIDWGILFVISIILQLVLKTVGALLSIIVQIGYSAYFEGTQNGQTIGKKVTGLQVVPKAGGAMDLNKGIIRAVGKLVSGIPCGLGFFWMLWDKDKETWHDKIAGTTVISLK